MGKNQNGFFSRVSVNVTAVRRLFLLSGARHVLAENRGMDMGAVSAAGSIGMLLKRQNHCLFSSFFLPLPSIRPPFLDRERRACKKCGLPASLPLSIQPPTGGARA